MTIDPETIRKGDMLMSPDKQLYNVTDAMRIDLQFAFADVATRDAALAEGWNPAEDDGSRVSYHFTLTSLDGQEKTMLTSMSEQPIPEGWEFIAQAPVTDEVEP